MTYFSIHSDDDRYPVSLRQIPKPPSTLWAEGDLRCLTKPCVALVGARDCTSYGRQVAFEFARDLVQCGVVVVSGLAYGIDTAAHQGALEGNGKTVAVLGCGIEQPYPTENLELKKKIAETGAVLTEFSPGIKPSSWTFPQRNRIISGLSQGVVVVEAGRKSGALITANFALDHNREVLAVPGSIHSPLSEGTNRLIQKGAKLVTKVEDILEELQLNAGQMNLKYEKPRQELVELPALTGESGKVFSILTSGPKHMDELVETSGLSVEKLSGLLVELEIDGRISSLPGSRYSKK